MAKNLVRVVLDTNILISAIGFGGIPNEVFKLAINKKIQAVSSPSLIAEFQDVINNKFPLLVPNLPLIIKNITQQFNIVQPKIRIEILQDKDDNRVLEASIAGGCRYIVTGDRELLELAKYKQIHILTAQQFMEELKQIN